MTSRNDLSFILSDEEIEEGEIVEDDNLVEVLKEIKHKKYSNTKSSNYTKSHKKRRNNTIPKEVRYPKKSNFLKENEELKLLELLDRQREYLNWNENIYKQEQDKKRKIIKNKPNKKSKSCMSKSEKISRNENNSDLSEALSSSASCSLSNCSFNSNDLEYDCSKCLPNSSSYSGKYSESSKHISKRSSERKSFEMSPEYQKRKLNERSDRSRNKISARSKDRNRRFKEKSERDRGTRERYKGRSEKGKNKYDRCGRVEKIQSMRGRNEKENLFEGLNNNFKSKIVPGSLGEILLQQFKSNININEENLCVKTLMSENTENSTQSRERENFTLDEDELTLRYQALQSAVKSCESNYNLHKDMLKILQESDKPIEENIRIQSIEQNEWQNENIEPKNQVRGLEQNIEIELGSKNKNEIESVGKNQGKSNSIVENNDNGDNLEENKYKVYNLRNKEHKIDNLIENENMSDSIIEKEESIVDLVRENEDKVKHLGQKDELNSEQRIQKTEQKEDELENFKIEAQKMLNKLREKNKSEQKLDFVPSKKFAKKTEESNKRLNFKYNSKWCKKGSDQEPVSLLIRKALDSSFNSTSGKKGCESDSERSHQEGAVEKSKECAFEDIEKLRNKSETHSCTQSFFKPDIDLSAYIKFPQSAREDKMGFKNQENITDENFYTEDEKAKSGLINEVSDFLKSCRQQSTLPEEKKNASSFITEFPEVIENCLKLPSQVSDVDKANQQTFSSHSSHKNAIISSNFDKSTQLPRNFTEDRDEFLNQLPHFHSQAPQILPQIPGSLPMSQTLYQSPEYLLKPNQFSQILPQTNQIQNKFPQHLSLSNQLPQTNQVLQQNKFLQYSPLSTQLLQRLPQTNQTLQLNELPKYLSQSNLLPQNLPQSLQLNEMPQHLSLTNELPDKLLQINQSHYHLAQSGIHYNQQVHDSKFSDNYIVPTDIPPAQPTALFGRPKLPSLSRLYPPLEFTNVPSSNSPSRTSVVQAKEPIVNLKIHSQSRLENRNVSYPSISDLDMQAELSEHPLNETFYDKSQDTCHSSHRLLEHPTHDRFSVQSQILNDSKLSDKLKFSEDPIIYHQSNVSETMYHDFSHNRGTSPPSLNAVVNKQMWNRSKLTAKKRKRNRNRSRIRSIRRRNSRSTSQSYTFNQLESKELHCDSNNSVPDQVNASNFDDLKIKRIDFEDQDFNKQESSDFNSVEEDEDVLRAKLLSDIAQKRKFLNETEATKVTAINTKASDCDVSSNTESSGTKPHSYKISNASSNITRSDSNVLNKINSNVARPPQSNFSNINSTVQNANIYRKVNKNLKGEIHFNKQAFKIVRNRNENQSPSRYSKSTLSKTLQNRQIKNLDIGGMYLDVKNRYVEKDITSYKEFSMSNFPPVKPVIIPLNDDSECSENEALEARSKLPNVSSKPRLVETRRTENITKNNSTLDQVGSINRKLCEMDLFLKTCRLNAEQKWTKETPKRKRESLNISPKEKRIDSKVSPKGKRLSSNILPRRKRSSLSVSPRSKRSNLNINESLRNNRNSPSVSPRKKRNSLCSEKSYAFNMKAEADQNDELVRVNRELNIKSDQVEQSDLFTGLKSELEGQSDLLVGLKSEPEKQNDFFPGLNSGPEKQSDLTVGLTSESEQQSRLFVGSKSVPVEQESAVGATSPQLQNNSMVSKNEFKQKSVDEVVNEIMCAFDNNNLNQSSSDDSSNQSSDSSDSENEFCESSDETDTEDDSESDSEISNQEISQGLDLNKRILRNSQESELNLSNSSLQLPESLNLDNSNKEFRETETQLQEQDLSNHKFELSNQEKKLVLNQELQTAAEEFEINQNLEEASQKLETSSTNLKISNQEFITQNKDLNAVNQELEVSKLQSSETLTQEVATLNQDKVPETSTQELETSNCVNVRLATLPQELETSTYQLETSNQELVNKRLVTLTHQLETSNQESDSDSSATSSESSSSDEETSDDNSIKSTDMDQSKVYMDRNGSKDRVDVSEKETSEENNNIFEEKNSDLERNDEESFRIKLLKKREMNFGNSSQNKSVHSLNTSLEIEKLNSLSLSSEFKNNKPSLTSEEESYESANKAVFLEESKKIGPNVIIQDIGNENESSQNIDPEVRNVPNNISEFEQNSTPKFSSSSEIRSNAGSSCEMGLKLAQNFSSENKVDHEIEQKLEKVVGEIRIEMKKRKSSHENVANNILYLLKETRQEENVCEQLHTQIIKLFDHIDKLSRVKRSKEQKLSAKLTEVSKMLKKLKEDALILNKLHKLAKQVTTTDKNSLLLNLEIWQNENFGLQEKFSKNIEGLCRKLKVLESQNHSILEGVQSFRKNWSPQSPEAENSVEISNFSENNFEKKSFSPGNTRFKKSLEVSNFNKNKVQFEKHFKLDNRTSKMKDVPQVRKTPEKSTNIATNENSSITPRGKGQQYRVQEHFTPKRNDKISSTPPSEGNLSPQNAFREDATSDFDRSVDDYGILCPFDLLGKCNDELCVYQHLCRK